MGLFNRCIVCAPNQANKTGSIFWFNEWDRWTTMYSRLSTILLVLGLVITFQCLAYTEALTSKWPLRRRKAGKKSLRNKLVWFLKLMTKQKKKNLKNLSFRMPFYSAFVTKRFIHQVELEKPKMFKTKKRQSRLTKLL